MLPLVTVCVLDEISLSGDLSIGAKLAFCHGVDDLLVLLIGHGLASISAEELVGGSQCA